MTSLPRTHVVQVVHVWRHVQQRLQTAWAGRLNVTSGHTLATTTCTCSRRCAPNAPPPHKDSGTSQTPPTPSLSANFSKVSRVKVAAAAAHWRKLLHNNTTSAMMVSNTATPPKVNSPAATPFLNSMSGLHKLPDSLCPRHDHHHQRHRRHHPHSPESPALGPPCSPYRSPPPKNSFPMYTRISSQDTRDHNRFFPRPNAAVHKHPRPLQL